MKFLLGKIIFIYFLGQVNAYAYIDPGSGILLWQGLIAVIGAIIIAIRNPVKFIKSILRYIRIFFRLNKKDDL